MKRFYKYIFISFVMVILLLNMNCGNVPTPQDTINQFINAMNYKKYGDAKKLCSKNYDLDKFRSIYINRIDTPFSYSEQLQIILDIMMMPSGILYDGVFVSKTPIMEDNRVFFLIAMPDGIWRLYFGSDKRRYVAYGSGYEVTLRKEEGTWKISSISEKGKVSEDHLNKYGKPFFPGEIIRPKDS